MPRLTLLSPPALGLLLAAAFVDASMAVAAGTGLSPTTTQTTDLLGLDAREGAAGLAASWRTRAVRGQRAPEARVVDSAGERFLRIEGAARAGWFVRQLEPPLAAASGRLSWSWRVPVAPGGADLRAAATDDAALRVFVSFGSLRTFGPPPRAIFYSLGGGPEPPDYARHGHASSRAFVVRVGDAAGAHEWRTVRVDPAADYVRAWGGTPPPIAVIGLLQDTDQTGDRAVADLRSLRWSPANAIDLP